MKSLTLFAMILLGGIATSSFAQSVDRALRQSEHVAGIEQEMGKLAKLHAVAQAIVLRRQTTQAWENEAWVNTTRVTYDYSGDLQTVALTETWDGDSWEVSTRTVTSYEGGRPSAVESQSWSGSAWQATDRTLYTYSGDRLSEIRSQTFLNNAWVDEERSRITQSSSGELTTQTDAWDGQSWVPTDRYRITQEGSDVVAISEEWSGSAWMNTTRTLYTGTTVDELFDLLGEFEGEGDELIGLSFFLRFPAGVQQEWDGAQWVNVSRQISERDANDRVTAVVYENWEDGAWVAEMRFAAEFNEQGKLATIRWQTYADQWMSFLTETFYYGNDGLLERIVDQFDFGFGATNSTQHLFEWTNTGSSAEHLEMPVQVRLESPYPNPFNPQSIVRFHLAAPQHATLSVYDAAGRLVATLVDGVQPAGDHSVVFDAVDLPSGVYFVRLLTPSQIETRPVTLLR